MYVCVLAPYAPNVIVVGHSWEPVCMTSMLQLLLIVAARG